MTDIVVSFPIGHAVVLAVCDCLRNDVLYPHVQTGTEHLLYKHIYPSARKCVWNTKITSFRPPPPPPPLHSIRRGPFWLTLLSRGIPKVRRPREYYSQCHTSEPAPWIVSESIRDVLSLTDEDLRDDTWRTELQWRVHWRGLALPHGHECAVRAVLSRDAYHPDEHAGR